ncbi:MAG: hypothetical protein HC869_22940 [Rhodospirillales bacterium]|nr:hypothetical protein [Rhodospirillales bacterium]
MKFSIQGRIKNLRLPDGKTALIYSIYEAVTNGVQAIDERFGTDSAKDGKIAVRVSNKQDKTVDRIVVTDNGVGLTTKHLESFDTCDTLEKFDIGGRGVGRLVWTKAFKRIDVTSTFLRDDGVAERVEFQFKPELDDSRDGLQRHAANAEHIGTTIGLSEVAVDGVKLTIAGLTRDVCHHFFPYFIAGSMPDTSIEIGKRKVDVRQYITAKMNVEKNEELLVSDEIGSIKIVHVLVEPRLAQKLANSILLTAQGRVVESIEIANKFALKSRTDRKAYTCVVSGPFLDQMVDQERTSFKARADQIEAIKDAALGAANRYLEPHIKTIRTTQRAHVVSLLQEHPQLAVSVSNVDEYVADLSPGMGDEEIGKTLFTLLYRRDRKVKAEIESIAEDTESKQPDEEEKLSSAIDELVKKVSDDAKLRLAAYTVKRHQIIQIARSLLNHADPQTKSYRWEKTVHEFICLWVACSRRKIMTITIFG